MKHATKAVVDGFFADCDIDSELVNEIDDLLASMSWEHLGQKTQNAKLTALRSNFLQRKAYEAISASRVEART